jgi:putative ABC transport system permease protein
MISGEQTGPRPPTFDPAVLTKAAALNGVRAAAGIWSDMATVNGEPGNVNGTQDLAVLVDALGTTPAAGRLGTLQDNQLVMSTEEAAKRKLGIGQSVTVQLSRGKPRTMTIVGTYPEVAMPGSYMLSAAALRDFGMPQPVYGVVRLADGTAIEQVLPQVSALVADSPEVSATDRSAFVKQQASGLDQVITMIQVLLALAILIAVLGVINTLALSVLERTRELGLLRAIGLGRAQTMRMVTVEAVVISVFGALLGVVVGAGLGAAAVRALKGEGITDLILPWADMGTYLLLAALVGVAAAVLPAIRAARLNVLNAIAHD